MHNRPAAWAHSGAAHSHARPATHLIICAAAGLLLLLAFLTDLDRLRGMSPRTAGDALYLISGAVAAVLVLWALRPRTSPTATAVCAAGVLAAALAASAGYGLLTTRHQPIGIAEAIATALVVPLVAYRCRLVLIGGTAVLAFVVMLAASQRGGHPLDQDNALLVLALLAPGFYARWRAEQRTWHVERAVREERGALARDLHDVVAHQVTGIVVQAQGLQHLAARDPETLRTALADIEEAGVSALTAMRRLVSTLRDGRYPHPCNDSPATALRALERPGDKNLPTVSVTLDTDLDRAPSEISAAVVRMAQESVTNADRHARGATRIAVRVRADDGCVRLDVRDDGHGPHRARAADGYGLIGMTERAKLLAGTFRAGPAPDGPGWHVSAALPADDAARRTR